MIRYFARTLAALVARGPLLYLLTVIGVALGVASVITIQLINANAVAAFAASVHAVTGDADLTVVSRVGGLDEAAYAVIVADGDIRRAWPTLKADATIGAVTLDIVATDLTQLDRFPLRGGERIGNPLGTPGWIAVSPKLGIPVGETLHAMSGTRPVTLTVGALVDFTERAPLASSALALMDIAQGQSVFATGPVLDEIGLTIEPHADRARLAERLRAALGPTVDVLTPDERAEQASGLLAAFRLNLTALSLISLAVGVFLIHSSLQATLVRRRAELGVLRALGATRAQVTGLILGEVIIIGVVGTLIGLPLGYWAARANIHVVSGTLTSLYLLQAIETLQVPGWIVAVGAGVGLGSAVLGASLSLIELRREDTRSLLLATTLQESLVKLAPRLASMAAVLWCAMAVIFGGLVHAWAPTGFVIAIAILATLALCTPWLTRQAARWVTPRRFGFIYSVRTIGQKLASNAFAIAALGVAISMMVGITLMVGSFRATLETWVGTSIQADIYVSPLNQARRSRSATLSDAVMERLQAVPQLATLDTIRRADARVGNRGVRLAGVNVDVGVPEKRFPLMHDSAGVFDGVRNGEALISEPLARKEHLARGDAMALLTPTGMHEVRIAGVFYDYATEQGAVFVAPSTFERFVGPGAPGSAALYLQPGSDVDAVVQQLKHELRDTPVNVNSNARLRGIIYDIFDQTFAITGILQAMSLLIAVCGITLTLLVLARERAAELALYRALGATRRQVFRLFIGHGVALAGMGSVLGALGGGLLALVLVFMINRAYFGWTIRLALPGQALAQQFLTIFGAAVIAAIYPALRASQTPASELVRDDL